MTASAPEKNETPTRAATSIWRYPTVSGAWTDLVSELGSWKFWTGFVLLLIVAVTIGHQRPVKVASDALWDAFEDRKAHVAGEALAADMQVIEISDDDYRRVFQEMSPLDVDALARLIAVILHTQPVKLVVALDTSASRFVALPGRIAGFLACLETPVQDCPSRPGLEARFKRDLDKIIWARAARPSADGSAFELRPVLGQPATDIAARTAVALLQPDEDGRVRRIVPFVTVRNVAFETVPVVGRPRNGGGDAWRRESHVRLRLLANLRRLSVVDSGEFLDAPFDLANKTVFLSGAYAEASTFYLTDGRAYPAGRVMAAAALAMDGGDQVTEVGFWLELLFDLGLALFVVITYHVCHPRPALVIVVMLIGGALFIARAVNFAPGYVLNLAALLAGVAIHLAAEGANTKDHTAS